MKNKLKHILLWVFAASQLFAQVQSSDKRYVRIGSLQSHFSAYGSERAWNSSYYEGMRWPADYAFQDNSVIKRSWIGIEDFTDVYGKYWEKYAAYLAADNVGETIFPVELKQTAKFTPTKVIVDGNSLYDLYLNDIDDYDSSIVADRVISNVVNTYMGLTVSRTVYAFSQQYHDNYFIKVYTYTNTGNIDYDDDIELTAPIKGLRIGWGTRYSASREGAMNIGDGTSWGKHFWVTKRGENYPEHQNDVIDETNPIVDWIRCGFGWAGQSGTNGFNNIGGPERTKNGRLTAIQHVGSAILHVDKSAADKSDDANQPLTLGWHAGDTYPKLGNSRDVTPMIQVYNMLSGIPNKGLGGTDRFDETNLGTPGTTEYLTNNVDPYTIHNDGGGTNIWVNYGPFDLAHGESITIVEAEGVAGLNREEAEAIGKDWLDATGSETFLLPDGTTTSNKDVFKNSWVYTGKDSIMQTFGRAKRNFDSGFGIPKAPEPPALFEIKSQGDKINLSWYASASESESNFKGYKIFRAIGKPDTTYQEIYFAPVGEYEYNDTEAARGFSYYYYIVSVTDGSKNSSGAANPTGELISSRFYTKTTQPAFLRRKPGNSLENIRVVPNPFNVRARELQFTGEPDKIMFLDIPGYCTIKIYTERGDLIKEINHDNGSGDETWNSVTSSRQVVTSGVYIAVFTTPEGERAIRKFVIIR
ncbi:MAG: hypothetical protein L3J41_03380 [Melioribacteraceae bacterium]|nr:hypothetical protein [Melioribacteraceae bacterium]